MNATPVLGYMDAAGDWRCPDGERCDRDRDYGRPCSREVGGEACECDRLPLPAEERERIDRETDANLTSGVVTVRRTGTVFIEIVDHDAPMTERALAWMPKDTKGGLWLDRDTRIAPGVLKAEQLEGLPVRVNFEGDPIGRVVSATEDDHLWYTMEIDDPRARAASGEPGFSVTGDVAPQASEQ